MLGLLVLAIHLVFEFEPGKGNESFFVGLLATIFFSSGAAGLTGVMLFITWMNRLMNVSTSGRWVTFGLLIVSLAPTLVLLDDLIAMTGLLNDSNTGYLPNYNFIIFGGGFVAAYMALVYYYQRSFHYAITSDAIIFEQQLFAFTLPSPNSFRIASQKLSLLDLQPAPLLGFATVSVLTDSGVGIVEESNVPVVKHSIPGTSENENDSKVEKAGKGLIRTFIGIMTYQRTIRTVRPDPKHCMYNIRKWEKAKGLLNEMHKKNSQSHLLSDLKKTISETTSKD